MRLSLSLILAGAGLVAACAAERPAFRHGMSAPPGGPGSIGRGGLFVSPAGEPFRRTEGGAQPMRAWFDQADADRDGAIGWAEFEADFVRYFGLLDADHDGEIAPAEVARYETEILPEMASRGGGRGAGVGMGGMGGGRPGIGRQGGGAMAGRMAMMAGAARFGLLPISHPIMDADVNFNRGVSREEFTQAAARRFALLDQSHAGRLTLEALVRMRMQAFGPRRRGGGEGASAPAPNPEY